MNSFSISSGSLPHHFFEIKPNLKIYDEKSLCECLIRRPISQKIEKDLIELLKETPQEDIGESWQNYVIFKDSNIATSLKYDADQERYGNWMDYTVKIAVKGLNEKGWSLDELLEFLCFARCYIGGNECFGNDRTYDMETACCSKYEAIFDFYENYIPDGRTCSVRVISKPATSVYSNYTLRKFIHISKLNNNNVKLSKIKLVDTPRIFNGYNLFATLRHTDVENISIIMEFVETELYPRALNQSDKQELIKDLGRIYWWICQAKPWERGDPSIAEMLIRSIWALKGFEQPAWKDGIIPWVEVSNEPDVEKFADNFHSLFK